MMTEDRVTVAAPLASVYEAASNVEAWPSMLPHYRWVRVLERHADWELVEMAAWRPFGMLKYPTWWVSEMRRLPNEYRVHYRHVRGITRGMDVEWSLRQGGRGVEIMIRHLWKGPSWPVLGRMFAELVVGPVFVHGIASRTLAGIKRFAEGVQRA